MEQWLTKNQQAKRLNQMEMYCLNEDNNYINNANT